MKRVRTVIVDDESLARDRLRQLLQKEPEVELAGEFADGQSALTAIRKQAPDLIFLDVQMPELDGFGVAESIGAEPGPVIVFVTAHDRFALRAFETHAVDYLLKPFDRERFQKALRRALEQVQQRDSRNLIEQQAALIAELRAPRAVDRLAVKSGGRTVWVPLEDVDWIGAADNYTELHVGPKSHLLRETLSTLEARLAAAKFVRISRSVMVNTERIREVKRLFYGGYEVTLRDGVKLTLSRRYREKLRQLGLA
jgi:two-component system LytT family response regulator